MPQPAHPCRGSRRRAASRVGTAPQPAAIATLGIGRSVNRSPRLMRFRSGEQVVRIPKALNEDRMLNRRARLEQLACDNCRPRCMYPFSVQHQVMRQVACRPNPVIAVNVQKNKLCARINRLINPMEKASLIGGSDVMQDVNHCDYIVASEIREFVRTEATNCHIRSPPSHLIGKTYRACRNIVSMCNRSLSQTDSEEQERATSTTNIE